MQLKEKIKECYNSGMQLWVVSNDPLSIPEDYDLFQGYIFWKIIPRDDVHRAVFSFTFPDWFLMPGSIMIDYSKIPKRRIREIPGLSCKGGKESVKFGIDEAVFDLLVKKSKETKEKMAAVPRDLLAEIDAINKAGKLPDQIFG